LQAAISDYEIALTPKASGGDYGWQVDATMSGNDVHADIDVLVWSDIVRDSMAPGIFGTYVHLARTAWTYIASGALRRLMWLRKGPVIAALYPVVMLIVQLLIALVAARLLGGVLGWLHPWLSVLGLAAIPAVLIGFRRIDNRLYAYYLMHDYAFSAQLKGANPPELEDRMAVFVDKIAEALTTDVDEVLIVGHSSGAHLGVSIIADLLRQDLLPHDGPELSFLSLGQVVPMISFLPEADQLRADLRYVSEREEITWVDVTAPGDGCSFALCDPVAVSGVATEKSIWPLVFSASFTQTLSPEMWERVKRRYFRLHFQYLCAFDRPKDYDYFQITAGPLSLGNRYEGRAPSVSRIDVSASKYTSVAA